MYLLEDCPSNRSKNLALAQCVCAPRRACRRAKIHGPDRWYRYQSGQANPRNTQPIAAPDRTHRRTALEGQAPLSAGDTPQLRFRTIDAPANRSANGLAHGDSVLQSLVLLNLYLPLDPRPRREKSTPGMRCKYTQWRFIGAIDRAFSRIPSARAIMKNPDKICYRYRTRKRQ